MTCTQVAAKELGMGVTKLKEVCRANGLQRWPFRKRHSLQLLVKRTQQLQDTRRENVLTVLESQRAALTVSVLRTADHRSATRVAAAGVLP